MVGYLPGLASLAINESNTNVCAADLSQTSGLEGRLGWQHIKQIAPSAETFRERNSKGFKERSCKMQGGEVRDLGELETDNPPRG